MQVQINPETKTVTMSLDDFTKHFSSSEQPENQTQLAKKTTNLEEQISVILSQLGVSKAVTGFNYLREAILFLIENPFSQTTTQVYPSIAKKFSTLPLKVERTMRHAIETSWGRAAESLQYDIFGCSIDPNKGKATNSEYISAIADYIKLKSSHN